MFKSGYVAIIGSPNAGKSTLLNEILDAKIAITSDKVGTTRNMIKGIHTDDNSQIVFVDTPGINTPKNKLQVYMKNQVEEALANVNLIIYLVDGTAGIRKREEEIINKIASNKNIPKIACLNKIDLLSQEKALGLIKQLEDKNIFDETFALSAKGGINVEGFLKTINSYLPEGELIYSKEQVSDFSTKFYISELIREKVLRNTYDEIPHGVYVKVDEIDYKANRVLIEAIIYVERESQKGIVIGNKAEMIKKVGKLARIDMEHYFDKKVFLELIVRVDKKWRDKNADIFDNTMM